MNALPTRRCLRPVFAVIALCTGCYAPFKDVVVRGAIEQQMATAAITRCVAKLDLGGVDPALSYALRVEAPSGVDTAFVRARLEERFAAERIAVRRDPFSEGPALVAVVPYAGVDAESSLFGIPLVVPGLPVTLGDISLYRSSTLNGRARLEMRVVGTDRDEAAVIPPTEALRYFRNVTVLTFVGPFRFSNLEQEPLPGDEE